MERQIEMILPYVLLLFGTIAFVTAAVFFMISIGFRRSNVSKANGYLERTNRKQNVYIGGKQENGIRAGLIIPTFIGLTENNILFPAACPANLIN